MSCNSADLYLCSLLLFCRPSRRPARHSLMSLPHHRQQLVIAELPRPLALPHQRTSPPSSSDPTTLDRISSRTTKPAAGRNTTFGRPSSQTRLRVRSTSSSHRARQCGATFATSVDGSRGPASDYWMRRTVSRVVGRLSVGSRGERQSRTVKSHCIPRFWPLTLTFAPPQQAGHGHLLRWRDRHGLLIFCDMVLSGLAMT